MLGKPATPKLPDKSLFLGSFLQVLSSRQAEDTDLSKPNKRNQLQRQSYAVVKVESLQKCKRQHRAECLRFGHRAQTLPARDSAQEQVEQLGRTLAAEAEARRKTLEREARIRLAAGAEGLLQSAKRRGGRRSNKTKTNVVSRYNIGCGHSSVRVAR